MADLDSVMLSGWIRGAGIHEGNYPRGWIRLLLDPVRPRSMPPVPQRAVFLSLALRGDRDRPAVVALAEGGWLLGWDLTLGSYVTGSGELRRTLTGSPGRISVTSFRGPSENTVLLRGTVKSVGPGFFELACSYVNPKARDPGSKWRENVVRVYADGLALPAPGARLYVRGSLLSHGPDGEELLCVLAAVIAA